MWEEYILGYCVLFNAHLYLLKSNNKQKQVN